MGEEDAVALAGGPACLRALDGEARRHGQGLEGPDARLAAAARPVFEPRGERFVGPEARRRTPQRDLRLEADEEVREEPRLGERPVGVPERLQRLPDGAHGAALRRRGRRAPPRSARRWTRGSAAELGVERRGDDVPLPHEDRVAVAPRQDVDSRPEPGELRRPDEDRLERLVAERVPVEVGERDDGRVELPAVGVPDRPSRRGGRARRRSRVRDPSARARIAPAHVREDRVAAPRDLHDRLGDSGPLHQLPHRRRLASREDEAPCARRTLLRRPDLRACDAAARERRAVRLEVALQGEDADRHRHQPRVWSSSDSTSLRRLDPLHPLAEALRRLRDAGRVVPVRRRLDDGAGAPGRVVRLEDARADEDGLGAEDPAEGRVGRRRDAAGREVRDREPAVLRRPRRRARTAPRGSWPPPSTRRFERSVSAFICRVTSRRCFTAWTMSPVPASPFVRIIAAPSPIRRSASPRFRQPQTNGTLKSCL